MNRQTDRQTNRQTQLMFYMSMWGSLRLVPMIVRPVCSCAVCACIHLIYIDILCEHKVHTQMWNVMYLSTTLNMSPIYSVGDRYM